jgi:hypothetical protein
MKKKERMSQMLKSTVEHYNSKNRAVEPISEICCYASTDKSEGCSVGRLLDEESKTYIRDNQLNTGNNIEDVINHMRRTDFKLTGILTLGKDFLTKVQELHDGKPNWDENGLSVDGKIAVDKIATEFELRSWE